MSKSPTRRPTASAPTGEPVVVENHRQDPGSYERLKDGSVVRLDEPTQPAISAGPRLSAKSAQAIADALEGVGHEAPAAVTDSLPAGATAVTSSNDGEGGSAVEGDQTNNAEGGSSSSSGDEPPVGGAVETPKE